MLRFYNTATRNVEEFSSIEPGKVGMYVCGLTVYNDMHLGHIGIEPLSNEFTSKEFISMIRKRKGTLKPLLLNQQFIAGIGNYLADEILFRASLHPLRTADTLDKREIKELS